MRSRRWVAPVVALMLAFGAHGCGDEDGGTGEQGETGEQVEQDDGGGNGDNGGGGGGLDY